MTMIPVTSLLRGRSTGLRGHLLLACASLLGLLTPVASPAAAGFDPNAQYVQAELLAQSDALVPGAALSLGVRLRHVPHWHTYWVVPGDAGLPTQLRWTLPTGFAAGPIEWPLPQRLPVGNLANYGYEGEVLLPVTIRVPDSARTLASATLAVHVDWLVCNELCIPGGADLSLSLPIRAAAEQRPGPQAALFAATRLRIPQPLSLPAAHASLQAEQVVLEFAAGKLAASHLEFFPLEAGRLVAAAEQTLRQRGATMHLELAAASPVEADFRRLRGVLVANGGPPAPGGWAGLIDLPLVRAAPAAASPAAPAPQSPSGTAAGAAPGVAPLPPPVPQGAAPSPSTAPAQPLPAAPAEVTPLAASPALAFGSVLLAAAGAFLGGLILNLMPCVFPVLSLKLMALVGHREESPARLRAHGLAYTTGVVLSFLALAGLLLALRAAGAQIGWGFQLQSPVVIAALIALFFLIGLNLLGSFEFTLGAGLANTRAAQVLGGEGLRGSFATGVLAAVVASPCTAPFMGAALGYAVTQSPAVALIVFAALGAGMAAPYLVLCLVPAWLARLPRPGAWMERVRHVLAFPMFLTCVWLYWVLGQQLGMDAAAILLVALVALSLFAWSLGLVQRGVRALRWVAALALFVALAAAVLALRSPEGTAATSARAAVAGADWGAWSPQAQDAALGQHQPVFVDFTAAWCITCQANKRLVLHDAQVEAAFVRQGVVRLQADWTRRDETISRELTRFARSGVPLYVLYGRDGQPHVLPEILSTQGVLEALAGV